MRATKQIFFKFIALLLLLFPSAVTYNNGLGKLPVLGWNGWCTDGPCQRDICYEDTITEIADAMVSTGLSAMGYTYVNLDDCWGSTHRTKDGQMQPNATRFPNGIKFLADYIHSRGLKFGLYTASGYSWCMHPWMQTANYTADKHGHCIKGCIPGMWGNYKQDIATFVHWDVDYLKLDWCIKKGELFNGSQLDPHIVYANVSKYLNDSGRQIWFSGCSDKSHMELWGRPYLQSWRTEFDHHDNWTHTALVIESMAGLSKYAGPYGWNDFDFVHTGGQGCGTREMQNRQPRTHCPGQTDTEYRTEFTMWVVAASSILLSTDVRNMTSIMRSILLNPEVLAVHQDKKGQAGDRVGFASSCVNALKECQIWSRPLSENRYAVALYNSGNDKSHNILFKFNLIDPNWNANTSIIVRNLWDRKTIGSYTHSYEEIVKPHGVCFLLLRKG